MTQRFLLKGAAFAALLLLAAPAAAEAQLGGLRRAGERMAERALRPESPAPEPGSAGSPSSQPAASAAVVEMTPEVIERFARALATEEADRREVARLLDPAVAERYQQCASGAMMTEEGLKLTEDFSSRSENLEGEALVRALREYEQALQRFTEQRCGAPAGGDRGELERRPVRTAVSESGFTEKQYAVLKERVVPFCRTSAPSEPGGGVRIGGQGRNIFFVYSENEAAALRPRCATLMPLVQAVL